mmetsp:Transcript_41038/g.41922  ORF Transcript_41038/g.41922 Transcript_41038/m.41922 type:complete len:419 (+) Transcript_41038:3-1259(+)
MMISSILSDDNLSSLIMIAIYTGDNEISTSDMFQNVKDKFSISFTESDKEKISLIYIRSRSLLEAKRYPVFTMLCQSLSSMIVAIECVLRLTPEVYIDTTGASFPYPLLRALTSTRVIAYVHYPTISQDMLNLVAEKRPSYNNDARITSSGTRSSMKLLYYRLFASVYHVAGLCADTVMVNSSWTERHIRSLWSRRNCSHPRIIRVYPPCNTENWLKLPSGPRKRQILSLGQFRPEKDHRLQLQAFYMLRQQGKRYEDVTLVMFGGCRGAEDVELVDRLHDEAKRMGLQDHVIFHVNGSYSELVTALTEAAVGLHTMWNEHFGISVVEMMAAGLVVVAHKSGGPLEDIIRSEKDGEGILGYLADSPETYADCLAHALNSYDTNEDKEVRKRARESVERFSDKIFRETVTREFACLLCK